jgi:transposase
MDEQLGSDERWNEREPILPKHRPSSKGGRKRNEDRKCLAGIIHVPKTGCQWQMLTHGEDEPSGRTCGRRFAEWTKAGLWVQVHRRLLNVLGQAQQIDLSVVGVDSASVRALKGGARADLTLRTGARRAAKGISSATKRACRG